MNGAQLTHPKRLTGWMGLLWLCCAGLAWSAPEAPGAAPSPDRGAERVRIAQQRRDVQARFVQAEQTCASQFQVNDCLAPARLERRQALDRLRSQQAALDEADRRQRAADRLQAQARRRQEAEARAAVPRPAPPVIAQQRSPKPASAASDPARRVTRVPTPPSASPNPRGGSEGAGAADQVDSRAKQAQRAAQTYAKRQQAAASHAESVARRNAERDKHRVPAAGLPVPAMLPASAVSPASGR